MKKSLIAGAGVSALAFAALPFAGVFAATSGSFTDTLTVGVEGGCTLENSTQTAAGNYSQNDRAFTTDIAAGNVGWLNATSDSSAAGTTEGSITVSCNTDDSTKTWTISVDVTDLTNGTQTITGNNAATSGATSAWAIKSNADGTTAANPFANYAAAADTDPFLSATANNAVTFNPSYRVYIAPTQAPGSYVGSAEYEITLPTTP